MQAGEFTLLSKLGAGAMGDVWRAQHRRGGFPVALKFASALNDRRSRQALSREIEAVAALHHPNIVDIYDIGTTDKELAESVDREIVAGTPWFAMQLGPGGALSEHRFSSWSEVRHVTLQILDALAHAHARGVIHRDLKPENVLIARDSFRGPLVLLTDFGISHVVVDRGLERSRTSSIVQNNERTASAGTPLYMAPEQFTGEWRRFGPWTDIYSLGCMLYRWVTGAAPFREKSLMRLAYRHCHDELPELEGTLFPVPTDLFVWLQSACAKRTRDRFQTAANAAHALMELATVADGGTANRAAPDTPEAWSSTTLPLVQFEISAPEWREASSVAEETTTPLPLPREWSRPESSVSPMLGSGLGLFGLRAIPFVDRNEAREAVWETIREASEEERPAAIVITGRAGSGKSRLVRWMTQRANETAGIETMAAFHGPTDGHLALPDMLLDYVRGQGAGRDQLEALVAARLPRLKSDIRRRLLDYLLEPGARSGLSPSMRNDLLIGALKGRVDSRPLILWLDDVIWGTEALGLTEHLLETAPELPVAIIMTARTEAFEDAPDVKRRLGELIERSGRAAALEPLGESDQRALVHGMLGLAPDLVDEVVARTEGNPLFAVQLVGDLVQRDELEPTPDGIRCTADADDIPETMASLWRRRLDELLGSFDDDVDRLQMLMIASAFGQRVERDAWLDILDETGVGDPGGLVDAMVRRRLARRVGNGWVFAHGLLREVVQELGRQDGRWIAANAACARWMVATRDERELDHNELARLGRYLCESEELEAAFDCILEAGWIAVQTEEMSIALSLLDEAEALADRCELDEADERRGQITVRRYLASRYTLSLDETIERCRELIPVAARHGWTDVEGEARILLGTRLAGRSEFDEALKHQLAARSLFEERRNEPRVLHAMGVAAYTLWYLGRREEGLELQHEVLARREVLGDKSGIASDCDKLGFMYLDVAPRKAQHYYRRGMELADELGRRELKAHIVDGLGRIAQLLGEPQEAVEHFREAVRLFELIGSPAASMSRFHQAHVTLIDFEEWADGLTLLERLLPAVEAFGVRMYAAAGWAGVALAQERLGAAELAEEALRKMEEIWFDEPHRVENRHHCDFLRRICEVGADDSPVVERARAFIERHGLRDA